MKVDEYTKKNEVECKIETKDYNTFIYLNEGPSYTLSKKENKVTNHQQNGNAKFPQPIVKQHIVGVKQQENNTEVHTEGVKHQEDNVEQEEPKPKRVNELEIISNDELLEEERIKEPILEKYIKRHHAFEKIIGDKEFGVMTRKRLRSETCLLCDFEPKSVKDALEDKDLIQAMNEEIVQIEKNKIWTLVPRPKEKIVI